MKRSLGPIPYFWSRQSVFSFYRKIRDVPVDIVYLGETICSKRRELVLDDWLIIADSLVGSGKEVVLSSLVLMEAESELSVLKRIVDNGRYPVEANDMAAVRLLSGRNFVIGPHINIYNNEALALIKHQGATRWVLPIEHGRNRIAQLLDKQPLGLELELFAWGKLPLGFSARCFSARAHNRTKDECGFVCRDYPNGMMLYTQDQDPFLTLNGIQIQSGVAQNLLMHHEDFPELGIDILRIAPQFLYTPEVIQLARDILDGRIKIDEIEEKSAPYLMNGSCDGCWKNDAVMSRRESAVCGTGY